MSRSDKPEIGVLYGFRALMILFVCNFHIWQQSWLPQELTLFGQSFSFDFFTRASYLFVDGLLLLSGFLLFLPYARQQRFGTPVAPVRTFYVNRLARIVPSYLLCVVILLLTVAIPDKIYPSAGDMALDVGTHLTFTFTFFRSAYMSTPLNAGLWTLAIEMQFYLLFPLLARAAQKRPALTTGAMFGAAFVFRGVVSREAADTSMYMNQLPAMLDVYALGFLGAMLYAAYEALSPRVRRALAFASPVSLAIGAWSVCALLARQSAASAPGYDALRLSQMALRFPFALSLLLCLLSLIALPRLLQKLFDNRLMRFLAAISLNLYIWHQVLCHQMLVAFFPTTLHSDLPLQKAFTLLSYSVAILTAAAVTWGVEKPAAQALHTWMNKTRRNDHERPQTAKTELPAD